MCAPYVSKHTFKFLKSVSECIFFPQKGNIYATFLAQKIHTSLAQKIMRVSKGTLFLLIYMCTVCKQERHRLRRVLCVSVTLIASSGKLRVYQTVPISCLLICVLFVTTYMCTVCDYLYVYCL